MLGRIVAATALCCGLQACATYSDVRAYDPVQVANVGGDVRVVAECTLDGLRMAHSTGAAGSETYQISNRDDDFHISAQLNGFFGPQSYTWDAELQKRGQSRVSVTVHAKKSLWGTPVYPDDLKQIVEKCGA